MTFLFVTVGGRGLSAKGGAVSTSGTVGQRAQELCDSGERSDERQAGDIAAH